MLTAASDLRVLVVDDDPHVRQMVVTAMMSLGLRVLAPEDGAPALMIAQQTPPDLVIVDVDRPTPGLEVVRTLKAKHDAAVWIAALSGRDDEATRSAAFAAGADDVLPKPVVPTELKRRVAAATRTQRALVEARRSSERAGRQLTHLSDVAARLSHNLNNCLAVALGNLAYLDEFAQLSDAEDHVLKAAISALRRMSGLIASVGAVPRPDDPAAPADAGTAPPARPEPHDARRP